MQFETRTLYTIDGLELEGDLALPEDVHAAAVLTHPHPSYGGDRHHPLVAALFELLPSLGCAAVRFDFRGVAVPGRVRVDDPGEVLPERHDVEAAVELLAREVPGVPLWLIGYSFGALVALHIVDPRVHGWIAVAPPLTTRLSATATGAVHPPAALDSRPKLLLVPQHDQLCDPQAVASRTRSWVACSIEEVSMTDHFLHGRITSIAERIATVVSRR